MNPELLLDSVEILEDTIADLQIAVREVDLLEPVKFHYSHVELAKAASRVQDIIDVITGKVDDEEDDEGYARDPEGDREETN